MPKSPSAGRTTRSASTQRYTLPAHIATRVEVLCTLHPHKKPQEIIRDLLELALTHIECAAAQRSGLPAEMPHGQHQHIYLLRGPFAEFHGLNYKHHHAMEKAADREESEHSISPDVYALGDND